MPFDLVAFLGIAVVVIVTPGQDMALTLRTTLLGGRRSGLFTALGVVTGLATWTIATSAGIAALLLASEPLFIALKLAGAAYLVYLGAQALRSALFSGSAPHGTSEARSSVRLTAGVVYRQGLLSNLGNPKIAVFFTSLLPQFIPASEASFLPLFVLGNLFCTLTLAWLAFYAITIARVGDVSRRPQVRRAVDGFMGAVLVAFGVRLATSHR